MATSHPADNEALRNEQSTLTPTEAELHHSVHWADIEQLEPNPYQPRRAFDPQEMEDLANSLREHGVLQPVLVRPMPAGDDASGTPQKYQIVAGERRWRAARSAGLTRIPVIVREVADQQALELALIENVQRHDITPIDAAIAYRKLAQEFGLSQENVAQRVGKSRAAVANTLRLLDLPADVQQAIEDGSITEGHGRAILLASGEGARRAIFRHVIREKLSVRDTEEVARKTLSDDTGREDPKNSTPSTQSASVEESDSSENSTGTRSRKTASRRTPEIKRFESIMQERLKTRVRLLPRTKGGQIVIEYFSNDDLERLLSFLTNQPQ